MEYASMSVSEVAEITGKSVETVRKWCRSGTLKARKPAGTRDYIIRKSDFDEFWEADPKEASN